MGLTLGRRNPFRPGAGALPPVLSGRERELELAFDLLRTLEQGDPPPRGLLFFGPRGNGKTTLLVRIAEDARRRGMRAEKLAVSCLADRRELTRRLQEKAGLVGARITGAQAAGFGVSAEPPSRSEDVEELLLAWIGAAKAPLVILLDEAHIVEPDPGRILFDAVQEATSRSLPFLLLAAGTPDAPRRLRRAGTFTERALQRVPVGRLERRATRRALVEPARDAGLPLSDHAAALLAGESQDYPYFIQLFGQAAWDAAGTEAAAITTDAAVAGADAARRETERFYAERYGEAREREVEAALVPLAALFRERGGKLRDGELQTLLRELAGRESIRGDRAQLLGTLSDLGVIWETPPVGWEMGIPSFADFLLAHHGGSRKA